MEGKVNYTTVGVFVVSLVAMLLTAIFWLSSVGHGKLDNTYEVLLYEDVTGLSKDSPVRFNGVKVGFVDSISLDKKNPKLVRLILKIDRGVLITKSTYAILNEQGITGVVNVNLKAQTDTATPLESTPGEPYPVIPSKPSLLMQLSNTLPELTSNIQELSGSISEILDSKNRKAITQSLQNIASITQVLANNATEFSNIMQNLDKTMENVSAGSEQFPGAMKKFNKTLRAVNKMAAQMEVTMQSGRVAINNFSTQLMPNAQMALENLSNVSSNVDQLTTELQRNPSMLVRGRVPAQPGP